MIYSNIKQLVNYGIEKQLIQETDRLYATNQLLEILQLHEYKDPGIVELDSLKNILDRLLDYAANAGILEEDNIVYRDLFDTQLMSCLTPPPSQVIAAFDAAYKQSPQRATDYYYDFSQNTNYIRKYRIIKDVRWKTDTKYGTLDLTINLSKPEKDPRAIAIESSMATYDYPQCMLCKENEGYAGHYKHPARQTHRMIPLTLNREPWYLQYSPYSYYPEHCIALNSQHIPMVIDGGTFAKLLDFVDLFPHYFIGSNADLPIVGGSILTHDHYQGGKFRFAMDTAPAIHTFVFAGYDGVRVEQLKWPLSVLRLSGTNKQSLLALAGHILLGWRKYSDKAAQILAHTGDTPHNTITPVARKNGDRYELDLALRNNRTTKERPHGLFHQREEMYHIKQENIGIIEVQGLAVLPARLKKEMTLLAEAMLAGEDLHSMAAIAHHADWAEKILKKYPSLSQDSIDDVLLEEIGQTFCEILEDTGVFKQTPEGEAAFIRFIEHMGGSLA